MPDEYSDDDYAVEEDEEVPDSPPTKPAGKAERPSTAGAAGGSGAALAKLAVDTAPKGGAAAPARPSSARLSFEGLPVQLPAAALKPTLVIAAASGAGRDANTLIIRRSSRGQAALRQRNAEPTEAQKAQRDLSHLYPPEVKTWRKGYLNELAYAITSKARAAEKRKEWVAQRNAAERAAREAAMLGGRKEKPGHEADEGGADAFYDRQDAAARRAQEARTLAAQEAAFQAEPVKKFCPKCGAAQTFQDWAAGIARCQKADCNGALFRPKRVWSEVQASFLARWEAFNKRKDANLTALDKATLPPFKLLSRTVFDKETGDMVEEPIEYAHWDEVEEGFFERQNEALERIKARDELAEAEARKAAEKVVAEVVKAKPYKFSRPLPAFWDRQMAALERRNMTFEERMEEMASR